MFKIKHFAADNQLHTGNRGKSSENEDFKKSAKSGFQAGSVI
jgi:TnpA family transposase